MQEAKHHESKTSFQLERFIFFSDGVFAICITLLVMEIKVPALPEPTDRALLQYLSSTSLKFFGFLLSFYIIGHYWIVHHRIFGYVKKSTECFYGLILPFCSLLFYCPSVPDYLASTVLTLIWTFPI